MRKDFLWPILCAVLLGASLATNQLAQNARNSGHGDFVSEGDGKQQALLKRTRRLAERYRLLRVRMNLSGTGLRFPEAELKQSQKVGEGLEERLRRCEEILVLRLQDPYRRGVKVGLASHLYANLNDIRHLREEGLGADDGSARAFANLTRGAYGEALLLGSDIEDACKVVTQLPVGEAQMWYLMGLRAWPENPTVISALIEVMHSTEDEATRVQCMRCLDNSVAPNVVALAQQLINDPSEDIRRRAKRILHAARSR